MAHPIITLGVAAAGYVPAINVGPAPETFFFRHEGVVNHGPHHRASGGIEARWKQHSRKNRVIQNLCEAAKVGILHHTRGHPILHTKRGNLAIHRRIVAR